MARVAKFCTACRGGEFIKKGLTPKAVAVPGAVKTNVKLVKQASGAAVAGECNAKHAARASLITVSRGLVSNIVVKGVAAMAKSIGQSCADALGETQIGKKVGGLFARV